MIELAALVQECAPQVAVPTMVALAQVESAHNPYAIGVVGGQVRQPQSLEEAVRAAETLEGQGKNFSLGIVQVNRHNLAKYGLDYRTAFEPCRNLAAGAAILAECYGRAKGRYDNTQAALRAALSCYYSGNFLRGFSPDKPGAPSYVDKVVAAAGAQAPGVPSLLDPPRPTGARVSRAHDGGPVVLGGARAAGEGAPANPKVVF
ncbi:MAG: lytic transglycosylase domain-containing protein [Azoarcus sp.]|jgi:type IV secretion system protein VirB1|nr:lytic transglycosylase domain-containing protein [Azoarcus sp.]